MKIVFRTNAGEEGLGHLNRTYALYKAFESESDFYKVFLVNAFAKQKLSELGVDNENIKTSEAYDEKDIEILKEMSPDLLVIDTYKATDDYITGIRKAINTVLIVFDDNNCTYSHIDTDILINGNIYAMQLNYKDSIKYHRGLLGPEYLVMNPLFWNVSSSFHNKYTDILITCGGADPVNIMPILVDYLKEIKIKKRIVIGPFFCAAHIKELESRVNGSFEIIYKPNSLKEYIERSGIILTASGSTVYEVLSLKRSPIIFIIGKDQELTARALEKKGIINLGWYGEIKDNLADIIEEAKKEEYHERLSEICLIFDGKGALRAAKEIVSYIQSK